MKRILTFGTFDLFHIGHLKILERARQLGDHLTVGVSTDALNFSKKGRNPVASEADRAAVVAALRCVDDVFFEHSLEAKKDYIVAYQADVLVMGDDWRGRFDHFRSVCDVVYFERTPCISTTALIEVIGGYADAKYSVDSRVAPEVPEGAF